MRKKLVITAIITTCIIFTMASVSLCAGKSENETISKGVSIDGTDVSGMTQKQARKTIKAQIQKILDAEVSIEVNDNIVKTTVSELGYEWTNTDVIEEALSLGKRGNIIRRYMDSLDIENDGKELNIEMSVSEDSIESKVSELCDEYNIEAKNATLTREGGSFSITKEESGIIVDTSATAQNIYTYLTQDWDRASAIELEAVTKVDQPQYTEDDCKLVTDVLGTYYTEFTTYSSSYNRNKNIENGARLLNGIVLYPQEQCSLNEHLEPWTEENGYYAAGTYQDGEVIDSLGGGICQVSSTLYNALLLSEIDIVERYPHSMAVSYVPLAADAALAGTYKDLVFKNNTDAPIYIEADYNSSGTLTFTVYGHETRAENRTIEYVSETISKTNPKTEITKDPDQPKGYEEITSNGHIGYVAKLWKYVYEDGEQVDKILVNTSTYASSPIQKIVGTGEEETEETTKKKKKKSSDETTTEEETTTKSSKKNSETTTEETESADDTTKTTE
ncbi:MAG: VanW family protein [Eubacterium sp.]